MKCVIPAILAVLSFSHYAVAADGQSPYDKNPTCLDRNVDSTKSDCIIQDDGTPRHRYPPRKSTTTPGAPGTPAAPSAPGTSRKSS